MKCAECQELMGEWEESGVELRGAITAHCDECPRCGAERDAMRQMRGALLNPAGVAIAAESRRTLQSVYDQIGEEEALSSRWGWRPFAGFLATAAIALFVVMTFSPEETTAFTIDDLTNQHRLCVFEGHAMSYHCSTETSFAEMTLNELGIASRPFKAPGGATFRKGGVCRIGGDKVAHALLDVDGETVSYFRLYKADEALVKEKGWVPRSDGVWSMERDGHLVVLRQFAE